MPEFPLLYINGEWRKVRVKIGSSTHYSVYDFGLNRWARIEKWRVWQALHGPTARPLAA